MLKVRRPSTLLLLLSLFTVAISANGQNRQIEDFVIKYNEKHLKVLWRTHTRYIRPRNSRYLRA